MASRAVGTELCSAPAGDSCRGPARQAATPLPPSGSAGPRPSGCLVGFGGSLSVMLAAHPTCRLPVSFRNGIWIAR